jgi:hypothetical protein
MAVSLHYLILSSPNARLSQHNSFRLVATLENVAYTRSLFHRSEALDEEQRALCMTAWLVGMGRSGDAATAYFRAHAGVRWDGDQG